MACGAADGIRAPPFTRPTGRDAHGTCKKRARDVHGKRTGPWAPLGSSESSAPQHEGGCGERHGTRETARSVKAAAAASRPGTALLIGPAALSKGRATRKEALRCMRQPGPANPRARARLKPPSYSEPGFASAVMRTISRGIGGRTGKPRSRPACRQAPRPPGACSPLRFQ